MTGDPVVGAAPPTPAQPPKKHRFSLKVGWHQGHLIQRCPDCLVERTARVPKAGFIRRAKAGHARFLFRRQGEQAWGQAPIPCAPPASEVAS